MGKSKIRRKKTINSDGQGGGVDAVFDVASRLLMK